MINQDNIIKQLEKEIDDLKDYITNLEYENKFSKEKELIEFIRELLLSLKNVDEKITKEDLTKNLKEYINEFLRENKIRL